MTCKYCGAPLPQDTLICPVCGKAQDSVSQEVEDQVQAALDQAQAALNGSAARDSHDDSKPEESADSSASREQTAASGQYSEAPAPDSAFSPEPEADFRQNQAGYSAPDETRDFSYSQEDEEETNDPAAPIYTQRRKGCSFPRQEEDPSVPTTGQYFFMELIMRLPIIGFIVSLFWGLSDSGSPHRRNLARANILLSLLGLVISLALIGILMGILSTIMAAFMSYGSYYNDYPEYFGDFFGHGDGYYDYYDDYYDDYYGYYGEYPYYFNSAPSA